jgi:hypothetical protein
LVGRLLYQNKHRPAIRGPRARDAMPNPLIKPNDPRFNKPLLADEQGKNPFAEPLAEKATTTGRGSDSAQEANVFAAAAPGDENRPYVPAYTAQQQPRVGLLLTLGILGWAASIPGAISLAGLWDIGWLAPLLGLGPAGACWLLAYEDLRAIRVGAIAAEAYRPTRHAFWLGITGLLACGGVVGAMIFRKMNFLPDVF